MTDAPVPCLSREDIARVACHDEDPPHLADCDACRAQVAEQRAARQMVRRAPAPPLPRARREAIAAEVVARVDMLAASPSAGSARNGEMIAGRLGTWASAAQKRRARRRIAGGMAAAAAAAAIALMSWPGEPHRAEPHAAVSATRSDPSTAVPGSAAVPGSVAVPGSAAVPGSVTASAPGSSSGSSSVAVSATGTSAPGSPGASTAGVEDAREPTIAQVHGSADFTRAVVDDRDVIALRGGSVMLDALETRDVEVTARNTTVRVDRAKVRVIARRGAIASVSVFAGAAEITAGGKRTVVEAGMVWVAPPTGPAAALDEFRIGWEALRAGKHRAAVTAFDRARDPVVAEDAVYWAAIASERAGEREVATQRFTAFIAKFPESPYVEAANRALQRLAQP